MLGFTRVYLSVLAAALVLSACGPQGPRLYTYQIVINGSTTPVPVEFTGSYACDGSTGERIYDISGEGTSSVSFECQQLLHVRIQRVLGAGLVSLTVYKDGVVVHSTTPSDSVVPIVYVPATE